MPPPMAPITPHPPPTCGPCLRQLLPHQHAQAHERPGQQHVVGGGAAGLAKRDELQLHQVVVEGHQGLEALQAQALVLQVVQEPGGHARGREGVRVRVGGAGLCSDLGAHSRLDSKVGGSVTMHHRYFKYRTTGYIKHCKKIKLLHKCHQENNNSGWVLGR